MSWDGDTGTPRSGVNDGQGAGSSSRLEEMQSIRPQLVEDTIYHDGLAPDKAEQVVEALIRTERARVTGQPFQYEDVEQELAALYREVGASQEGFEKARAKVWAAARETQAQFGGDLNQGLFFCFHESIAMHREYQATQLGRRRRSSGAKRSRIGVLFFGDPADGDLFG